MGFIDSLKQWFSNEAAEVKSSAAAAQSKLEAEMDRRESDLAASAEEKLEQIQGEIADDPFAEIRDKIDGDQAHAEAVETLDHTPEIEEVAEVVDAEVIDPHSSDAKTHLPRPPTL